MTESKTYHLHLQTKNARYLGNGSETKEGQLIKLNYRQHNLHKSMNKLVEGMEDIIKEQEGLIRLLRDSHCQSNAFQQLWKVQVNKNVSISDLDLRLQLHENTTYDGKILWKIHKISYRRVQAITGNVTAIHSPPSYVGRYGYKFCARLYMNGDGMGKRTHLSLYIVIMKSECDNLLQWPFQRKVYMTLINQKNHLYNVSEKITPSEDSPSFQRPKKEMNVASGCPTFYRIDRLRRNGFIEDDCMFIEVKVE